MTEQLSPQMRKLHERIIRLTTEIIVHSLERRIVKQWVKDFERWSLDALTVEDEGKYPECPACGKTNHPSADCII